MKKVNYIFLTLLLLGITTVTNAQAWTQVGADIEGQGVDDNSGYCVSLSADGNIVAIGSHNAGSSHNGRVRVFQRSAGTWTQLGIDICGEADNDHFGIAVSLNYNGTILAVGAHRNGGAGSNAGHVRIFKQLASGNWIQQGDDIDGEAAGDRSGYSVSLSDDGNTVAIGAYFNDGTAEDAGHVRIYQYESGSWTQKGDDIDGEAAGDYFGMSVSLSPNASRVAVGAPYNDGTGDRAGHVRIFQFSSGSWTQVGADINGEAADDFSGRSVSLSDFYSVAIGAPGNSENGTDAGLVRVFRESTGGNWLQLGFDIDGEAAGDNSGRSVSLSSDGETVAVGAYRNDGTGLNAGHVRIYHFASGNWTQVGDDIDGEAADDESGIGVSLSNDGNTVAIGAHQNDGIAADAGHVRIYSFNTVNVDELILSDISIFPNPTSGMLHLEFAGNNIQKIVMSDLLGKLLIEKSEIQQNEIIDLSAFESGMYILSIQTDKEMFSTKIVKE
jgi:hypothetical protein